MEWLSAWLKTVIIVILFAAFVDLLLPSSKMQRYVKTVLSLFILLTLLSPVLELLRGNWNVEKLLADAEREQAAAAAEVLGRGGGSASDVSLQAVAREGDRLKQSGDKLTAQLAEKQIADAMGKEIERETEYEALRIEVQTATNDTGQPFVSSVDVLLRDKHYQVSPSPEPQNGKASQASKPVAQVKPIEPVEINVEIGDQRQRTDISDQQRSQTKESASERKARDEVIRMLQRSWGVSVDRVLVRFEAVTPKS